MAEIIIATLKIEIMSLNTLKKAPIYINSVIRLLSYRVLSANTWSFYIILFNLL